MSSLLKVPPAALDALARQVKIGWHEQARLASGTAINIGACPDAAAMAMAAVRREWWDDVACVICDDGTDPPCPAKRTAP